MGQGDEGFQPGTEPEPGGRAATRRWAVALLNLTGLGLGYVLLRRWPAAVRCWTATLVLLLVALPADTDGTPWGVVAAYVVVLLWAAADGARRATGSTATGAWPVRPAVALGAGLALLAVPAGGTAAYDAAVDEAVEQMLLDRLDRADVLVEIAAGRETFARGEDDYHRALGVYRELGEEFPESRAGQLVPERLAAYYASITAPYRQKEYCPAIEGLTYLRTVPGRVGRELLGDLAGRPDEPLATSLLECGTSRLGSGAENSKGGELGELLRTFPRSVQAAEVEPAVRDALKERTGELDGDHPCRTTTELRAIDRTAQGLPEKTAAALDGAAGKAVRSGTYTCGVDEFKDKHFSQARQTLDDFADTYKDSDRRGRARDIAIAAEIAQERAAAGKRLPRRSEPRGPRMQLTLTNGGPESVEVLYTGPVTGTVRLPACEGCDTYSSVATASQLACQESGVQHPRTTLRLPPGDYHFLYKHGPGASTDIDNHTNGRTIEPGYTYTDCAYVVQDDPWNPSAPVPELPELPEIPELPQLRAPARVTD